MWRGEAVVGIHCAWRERDGDADGDDDVWLQRGVTGIFLGRWEMTFWQSVRTPRLWTSNREGHDATRKQTLMVWGGRVAKSEHSGNSRLNHKACSSQRYRLVVAKRQCQQTHNCVGCPASLPFL
jgi:hypothetical protein